MAIHYYIFCSLLAQDQATVFLSRGFVMETMTALTIKMKKGVHQLHVQPHSSNVQTYGNVYKKHTSVMEYWTVMMAVMNLDVVSIFILFGCFI